MKLKDPASIEAPQASFHQVGYMPLSFVDLVFTSERIEIGLRKGNFDYVAFANSGNRRPRMSGMRNNDGEAHVMAAVPTWPNFPQATYNPNTNILPNNITIQPISVLSTTHHPTNQEHPINHKGYP